MRAVTSRQKSIEVIDRETPIGEGELIRVTSSGICGSDLHMVELGIEGIVLGHEYGGYTTDGRLVAVRPTGECGTCPSCLRRHSQTCNQAGSSLYGMVKDGGLAEYARVDPDRLYEVPQTVSPTAVGLVEPLAVVIHGINNAHIADGMRTLVVGAGSIGLMTAAVLRDRGANVDIIARHPHQRSAAEKLSVHAPDSPHDNYDITFDAVCTQSSFDTCVTSTRPGGSLVEFGMFWEPVTLNNSVMMKEISIVPSIFYGHTDEHDDFAEAIDFLARHPEMTDALVTHIFSLDNAREAFRVAKDKTSGAIKVHFHPEG